MNEPMPRTALTTAEMLMALEEMPPYTTYAGVIDELLMSPEPVCVHRRCDCDVRGGGYVVDSHRLSGIFPRGPECFPERDAFVLNLGYRGVHWGMVWTEVTE